MTRQTKVKEKNTTTCPDCDGQPRTEGTEVLCGKCGLIIDERRIDPSPEWRAFDESERQTKKRTGSPNTLTMHDLGMQTEMGSIRSVNASPRRRRRLRHLAKWDSRNKETSKDRGLKFALGEINRMCSELEVPDCVGESAAKWFRDAHSDGLVNGRTYEGIASACVYIGCRKNDLPRTYKEVASVSRETEQKIYRSFSKLNQELDLRIRPVEPKRLVPRYASELGMEYPAVDAQRIEKGARYFINLGQENGVVTSRSPCSVVAGAIYLTARKMQEPVSQTEVADIVHISEVTVRSTFKDFCDTLGIDNLPEPVR